MAKQIISDIIKKKVEEKPQALQLKIKTKLPRLKILSGVFIAIVFVFSFFLLTIFFSSAVVKITPRQESVNVSFNFDAFRDSSASNLPAQAGLPFETMQLEYEQSKEIEATGFIADGQKASGIIAVYNAYSSKSQKLVSQTRFEAPGGKIYRIHEAITVPANGSVEAKVFADKSGPEYNIGFIDFTIPGFKGTQNYEKIYGRSKTEITGGFSGGTTIVSDDDIRKAKDILEPAIENYLKENIAKQKPEGFLLYPNAIKINFSDNLVKAENKFILQKKGMGTGFLIKKTDISKEVVKRYFGEGNFNIRAEGIENAEFKLTDNNENNTKISFNLGGKIKFVWEVDRNLLFDDLIVAEKNNYEDVFKKYPDIREAEIVFKPFWWHKVPKNKENIHLEEIIKE